MAVPEAWKRLDEELVADMRIFQLYRVRSRSPRTGATHELAVLDSRDWVNVVALTTEGSAVLVRQFRHGTSELTLEIVGGIVDAGETPADAALRELREETGYVGDSVTELGVVTPNPAFLDNRCHTYLVENCQAAGPPEPDEGEDIEVVVRPLDDIPQLIASGAIHHALVVCGFWWLAQKRPDLLRL